LSKWTVERDFIVLVAVLFAVMVVASAGLASWYLERLAQARNAIKQSQAEVEQLAFHDHLTHLPNRLLLTERLSHALASSLRHQRFGVLLFMDLDNFKNLNDTQGHDTGDLLLKQVAQRLTGNVRSQDTVARLGGDEFVIMLEDLADTPTEAGEIAQRIGEKLLAALNQPYVFGDQMHKSSASLGAALFGGEPMMPAELLKQADIAMYQAKAAGRNALCFFDPQMQEAISAHAALEADLQIALAQEQFRLYYQSQIDHLGRVVGAEVLIRWLHPDRGLVPPGQFIAVAEESELINQIGLWVLRTACAQLRVWQSEPVTAPLQLSVNVSARQFRQSDFVQQVEDVLAQSAIQPNGLKLELTESLVLANVADTIAKMSALKELGVRFSMDDFGTGQSSLSYLTRLPLDQLKIDQSFVRNIGIKSTDGVIVQTIIGMARNLGLEVIAEGVETQAQLNYLAQHGCLYYQGYLFGKPAPLEQFELQLAHHHQKAQLPA
jgi:diguanylate cyclase (GGDEF)-like protein